MSLVQCKDFITRILFEYVFGQYVVGEQDIVNRIPCIYVIIDVYVNIRINLWLIEKTLYKCLVCCTCLTYRYTIPSFV